MFTVKKWDFFFNVVEFFSLRTHPTRVFISQMVGVFESVVTDPFWMIRQVFNFIFPYHFSIFQVFDSEIKCIKQSTFKDV